MRAGRGVNLGFGAIESVRVAKPLASMSSLRSLRLGMTLQNSRSWCLLCDISTMSPGVMGGSGELAAESQLFGMLLVRLFRIVSYLGAENEVPDLLYLLAWQISFSSGPVSIMLVFL